MDLCCKDEDSFNEIQHDDEIHDDEIPPCFMSSVLISSRLLNSIHDFIQNIYKSHAFITNTVDYLFYKCKQADSCIKNHRIEPMEKNHTTIGWIYMDQTAYHYSYSLQHMFFSFNTLFDRIKVVKGIIYNNRDTIMYPWLRIRRDYSNDDVAFTGEPKYICRSLVSFAIFDKLDTFFICPQKSSVRFLSLEYYHEKNPNAERIGLSIDPEYLYEMNELFMPAFIFHLLEHQDSPFYFDMAYTLHIMDNNINIVELKSDQYLLLKRNEYQIHNVHREILS